MLYPLKLTPVLKEYLWGGTKLKECYHKKCDFKTLAESWELSVHPDGENVIENGKNKGMRLGEYLKKNPAAFGTRVKGGLPLLIKLIDAADNLSIQVHPDDKYAWENEKQDGKTELWYVMDCEPNAGLYYGFAKNIDRAEFIRRTKDGSILDVLNYIPVKKGDAFLVKPGTIHAIGKNITVAEIGTNCNITYRIYDFGRKDAKGNLRPLHLEQAAEVTDFSQRKWVALTGKLDCGPFQAEVLNLDGKMIILEVGSETFAHLICMEGSCELSGNFETIELQMGESVFIPANLGTCHLKGKAELLKTTV